jgi:SAM-dependent methyltransferase
VGDGSLKPEEVNYKFFSEVASSFDEKHRCPHDEHYVALKYISGLASAWRISSVLDVGCGTGQALRYLMERGLSVRGVEPVPAMIAQALGRNGIPPNVLVCASGERLPFADDSFDAVCAFGVLHHLRQPSVLVREMMRVARKAVFLSDANRFGQASMAKRLAKLVLYRCGLWKAANFVKTKGKGHEISESDGLYYSYSVYDSYDLLAQWADEIVVVGTAGTISSWFHPLLTSDRALLCAMKNETPTG